MSLHKYAGIVGVCNVISLSLILVGICTNRWITSDVAGDGDDNRGDISFGLFKIRYSIKFKETDYRKAEDNVFSFYDGVFSSTFYASCVTFIFLALAMTLVSLCLAVINTLSVSKHKITGPLAMLTFNFVALTSGVIGFGLFVAVYLQDMDNVLSLEQQTLFPTFTTDARFGYSFYVLVAGTGMLCGGIIFSPLERRHEQRDIQRPNQAPGNDYVLRQLDMIIKDENGDMILY